MTQRLTATTSSAEGRSPAASALWDPDGGSSPSLGAVRVPLFSNSSGTLHPIVYCAALGVSRHSRSRAVR